MNDCEKMIIDELKELKQDVKNLLLDVHGMKVKAAVYGMIGAGLFTLFTIVTPIIIKKIEIPKAAATTVVDTVKIHANPTN